MQRIDYRIWIGAGLILLGGLMLLERFGLFPNAIGFFWGALFLAAAAYFLYRFAKNSIVDWWAAIPGFALAGLAMEGLLPGLVGNWGGTFFLGFLGLGFFAVYLSGRHRWWAIIPGGVLITLAVITVLTERLGIQDTGSFMLVGLGLTFLLVALLASKRWAYIPGVVLLAIGAVLGTAYANTLDLLWPIILVICGLLLIWRFARKS